MDGDKAGLRAAYRLIDLSLPLLRTGKALRFSIMPEGKDPDDLIRNEGASIFKNLIDEAVPMVDLIWKEKQKVKASIVPRGELDWINPSRM